MDNEVRFEFDGSQLERQADAVNKSLESISASMVDVEKFTEFFNKQGVITDRVLQGMSTTGVKFKLTLSNLTSLFPKANLETEKYSKSLTVVEVQARKANSALSRLRANLVTGNAIPSVTSGPTTIISDGKEDEAARLRERQVQEERRITHQKELQRKALAKLFVEESKRLIILRKQKQSYASSRAEVERLARLDVNTKARLRFIQIKKQEQAYVSARKRVDQLRKSLHGLGETGKKSGSDVLLSWRSVVRLFAVQALHQSIALLRRALEESGREAFQYSKSIAEIRTITDDATETTKDWSAALRQLSTELPFTQIQLAEAAYQALSNQIIGTTDDLAFLVEAGDLAIVSVSNITTSTNALTSVMNAFDISLLRTRDTSAKLFKTIELGRTRLETLEQNLGRVSILSSKLGVSFSEQQAALDTLTIQGLKDNVAKTLLVNIYNKLIRPSEKMKSLFEELGVASGESAVATFGLTGFLQILFERANASGDAVEYLGETAQRVRATIGLLGLEGQNLSETQKELESSLTSYGDKIDELRQSQFVKLQQEFVNLNTLMVDVGQTFNKTLLQITELTGGLDKAVILIGKSAAVLGVALATAKVVSTVSGIAVAIVTLQEVLVATGIIAGATSLAVASIFTAGLPLLAGGVAAYLLFVGVWKSRVEEQITSINNSFQDLHSSLQEDGKAALQSWVDRIDETAKESKTSIAIILSEINLLITKIRVDLKNSFKDLNEETKLFGKTATESLRVQIDNIGQNLSKATGRVRELISDINSANKSIPRQEQEIAERKVVEDNVGKPLEFVAKEFEKLNTESALEKAKSIFEKIKNDSSRFDEVRLTAARNVLRIEREITKIKQAQLNIDKTERAIASKNLNIEKQRITALENAEKSKKQLRADLGRQQDELLSFDVQVIADTFDPVEGVEKQVQRLKDVQKETLKQFDQQSLDFFNTGAQAGVSRNEQLAFEKQIQKTRQDLIRTSLAEIATLERNALAVQFKDRTEFLTKSQTEAETLLVASREALFKKQKDIVDSLASLQSVVRDPDPDRVRHAELGGEESKQQAILQERLAKSVERALQLEREYREAVSRGIPDEERITDLVRERSELLDNISAQLLNTPDILKDVEFDSGKTSDTIGAQFSNISGDLFKALDGQLEAQDKLQKIETAWVKLRQRINQLDLERQRKDPTGSNTTSINKLTTELNRNILPALKDLSTRLNATVKAGGFATGGIVTGPSGVDNVPAWLTSGEFVMNAKATRQNLPVLQAMNNPQQFARGGRVQNIQIGDITVTGGDTSQATARQIARDLQREISRGTLTL